MARLRLFAGARAAAGTGRDELPGLTVAQVLDGAVSRYGRRFEEVLAVSRVWVNGEPAATEDPVTDDDEVAVLPPVSGGAVPVGAAPDQAPAPPAPPAPPGAEGPRSAAGRVRPAVRPAVRRPVPPSKAAPAFRHRAPLRPVPPAVPHGRLGVLWGVLTAGAVLGGIWTLATWLAIGALVAVLALARSRGLKPVVVVGAVVAALAGPLLAPVGWWAPLVGLGAAAAMGGAGRHRRGGPDWFSPADPQNSVTLAGLAAGLGTACLVLIDRRSLALLGLVLALSCLHDASRYLVGWGAPSVWEGRVAGLAAVGSATLAIAVLDPSPLHGSYAWLLGALVVGAGALGLPSVRRMEGDEAVGPLRRLDTLLLAAPAILLMAVAGHL